MTNGYITADDWKYSHAHKAVLGPFGELLTEEDLVYLQQQIDTLSLQKHCQAYELELTRLTEELRAFLPDPILNISLNKEVLEQMTAQGKMQLTLPLWCSRVSEIVRSMSVLVDNLSHTKGYVNNSIVMGGMVKEIEEIQGLKNGSGMDVGREALSVHVETSSGCRIPHIGMASAFSHRLETNSCSRAQREKVEREIQLSGVSVRTLRCNFEGQIGGIYPFAGVLKGSQAFKNQAANGPLVGNSDKSSTGLFSELSYYEPAKTFIPVMETTSLRKERIVVLFLSHWKRSAYAISLRAAKQTAPPKKIISMFEFCQQRVAVNNVLNTWRKKLALKDVHVSPLSTPNSLSPGRLTYSPEQFLPAVDGVLLDHDSLTLDLFMLGYFHILEQDLPPEERKMRHLLCFEVFDHVGSFPWETVLNFHKAVIKEIQSGKRQWSDGFEDIKVRFFGAAGSCCGQSWHPSTLSSSQSEAQLVPEVTVQAAPPESSSDTDVSCFDNEDICKYIDRSFAFWKEKEAEIFDFGHLF